MLKSFVASALILGSTLTMSAPVAAQTLIQDSTNTMSASVAGQTQDSVEATSYQKSQTRGAYVCTRDRYGYLNLRSGPSLRNRIIGRINNRQYLTILNSSGNWYKVNHRGRIGWVSGDYICGGSRQPIYTPTPTPTRGYDGYICTRDRNGYLNLRERPTTRSRILARIPNGDQFIWYGGSRDLDPNSFIPYTYQGRISGYVSARYVCFY